jgi:hypothetical protein
MMLQTDIGLRAISLYTRGVVESDTMAQSLHIGA